MIELEPRQPSFWTALRDYLEVRVTKFSRDLEEWAKWDGPKPWVDFRFNWSENETKAYIRREGLQAEIGFTLGLLITLEDAAQWMNTHEPFRSKLRLAANLGGHDFSRWIIYRWCDWIFHHEVGHFFCGHLSSSTAMWVEGEVQQGRDVALTQAMEADADMFAAFLYFDSLHRQLSQNTYQDFYRTNDLEEIFWDLGMLFAVLFVVLEYIGPSDKVRTHPKAPERLLLFFIEGMSVYRSSSGKSTSVEEGAMWGGFINALVVMERAGKEFADLLVSTKLPVETWKELLLSAKIDERRLFKLPNDWIFRRPLNSTPRS
ncbi:MAG: hypothetical protein J0I77_02740 [Rudaea sp.]|uniref:hypothetical protein n=1 Tax=unclassified Rudaea TaxID=2627037 RepID=UPI0010F43C9F|nr:MULTISPECIES: hypothetical protein [unclassified Rudaea]MBN8884616.1 hypothetical protein [Rudaea sp.]